MKPKYDLWQRERERAEDVGGLKVLKTQETIRGENRFFMMIWKPKAFKPFANYYFKTEAACDQYLQERVSAFAKVSAMKAEWKQSRKVTPEKMALVNIGDIFVSSWGYEQTNVDFYQVVEKKGSSVVIREICARSIDTKPGFSPMSDHVVAVKDAFCDHAEPMLKRVQFSNNEPSLKIKSYAWAYKWDGREQYRSW